ncbi:spore coat associated protein CotJA [Butyricicoccus pullicaecorum]|uniref:spore coat associated protein CotJA n=1 Tax=Butyricicoccus pullicaecorum TaxID=501571 RepID=UPI003520893B
MFYDPLAPCRDARDGCETPPTDEDNGNQNGGNGNNEPSTPDLTPPVSPTPPDDDQDENGQNGTLPVDAIDPRLLALAMGFVPYQSWETPYATDVALSRGTIFPGLDKPFLGERPVSDSPSLRWGG